MQSLEALPADIHSGYLPTMCRVRFGLTGIYFDSLEPSRPREEFFQPLIASIPPVLQNKQGDAVPEAIIGGVIHEKVVDPAENAKNDQDVTTKSLSDSSSSSSRDEGCRLAKKAKTGYASIGSKRVRNSASSLSSPVSSSSASSPPSGDEDWVPALANSEADLQAPKPSRSVINSRTTQKRNRNPSKGYTRTSPGGLTKAPPAKRVRFAMDVQESITPGHDAGGTSSSHSSDDSYTDPPSPTEPYDTFGGSYRTPGASRLHHMDGQIAGWGLPIPAGVEAEIDGYDGFLDSEDGSEVDVQALPVKRRPPRTVKAAAKGLISDQRDHQSNSTPAPYSKHSGRVMDRSRVDPGNLEGNADNGLYLKESHTSQKQPVSLPRSREQLRYPKMRSGRDLAEPIFVVRPRFLSNAKEKEKPAGRCSGGGHTGGISKNGHEGTKAPAPRPTRIKTPKKNRTPQYRPPSVTDEFKRDAEFDEGLGMLIREV